MNFIKFLGTAGARFVMVKQLRSSGGIWISYNGTNIIIDPGPGSLVKCFSSRPFLDPAKLDAVILTHKHIDHSNDVNVMVEAMTEGGLKKRGVLFVPADSLGEDGVVFSYIQKLPERVEILKPGGYEAGSIKFSLPVRNDHPVETYGLKFVLGEKTAEVLSDTKYFSGLKEVYKGADIIILNVVFYDIREGYYHLSLPEAMDIIKEIKPKEAFITHFGMTMLKVKPRLLEDKIKKEGGVNVKFAYDGLMVEI